MVASVPAEVVLARLTTRDRRSVIDLRDGLRDLLGSRLKDVRLFGSKVRGDVHDESDIDILVLVDGRDSMTTRAITDLADGISPWLSPVIVDYDAYHAPASRASGFYEELRQESVRL